METYYHINWDKNCNWKIGDEILFKEDNNYWRSFAEKGEYVELNGEQLDVYQIAANAFNVKIQLLNQFPSIGSFH